MSEGGVANDGNGRMNASIGSTLGHRNRSTHIDTRIDSGKWRKCAESIASDIAEDTCLVAKLSNDFANSIIHVTMSTTLTELWRTTCKHRTWIINLIALNTQSLGNIVGIEFACTWKGSCQTTIYGIIGSEHTTDKFLNHRLSILDNKQILRNCSECNNVLLWEWIL